MLTWGNLKSPYLDDPDVPDIGGQALAQAKRDEIIHGAGPALAADSGTVTSLMASDGFNGLLMMQQDTAQVWARKAGATIPLPVNVRRQLDTAPDTAGLVMQAGLGKIAGSVAAFVSETVTFPVAFKAGTLPIVTCTFAGVHATGAFDPTTAAATAAVLASVGLVIPASFTAFLAGNTGSLASGQEYYYSWIALGEPA